MFNEMTSREKMVKLKPRQMSALVLGILLGTVLLSGVYIFDTSGTSENLGFIHWELSSSYATLVFVFFLIGTGCGALLVSLVNISKGWYVLLISLFSGSMTVFLYALVTVFANLQYLIRPTNQHYAWTGAMGYIGDALFVYIVIIILYGLFVILGFLVGGLLPFFIKKTIKSKEPS
jgi:hypothetical protein